MSAADWTRIAEAWNGERGRWDVRTNGGRHRYDAVRLDGPGPFQLIASGITHDEYHTLRDAACARAVLAVLADKSKWLMDKIANLLDEAGIESPRPSEVLLAYFDAMLAEDGE